MSSGAVQRNGAPDAGVDDPVVVPISFAEERVWFLHNLAEEQPLYSVPVAIRLRGGLDVDALAAALELVAKRQENLRASFLEHEGQPIKLVYPDAQIELVRLAARGPMDLIDELIEVPFSLDRPPLLRAYLIEVEREERILFINAHHVIFDDRSVDVLVHELDAIYRAALEGREPVLPDLPIQYPDYAAWQRGQAGGPDWRAEERFWAERLSDPPGPLGLAAEDGGWSISGRRCEFTIGWSLMAAARAAAQDATVTPFSFFLTGFQLTLLALTGAREMLIGVPVDNRGRTELRDLIGFFVNTVAVRLEAEPGRTVEEQARAAQAASREALAHSALPFQTAVKAVDAPRDDARNPLFDVAFAMRGELPGLSLPEVDARQLPVHNHMATFDLMMVIEERRQDGAGFIEFADSIEIGTARQLAANYLSVLAAMAAGPGTSAESACARIG